MAGSELHESALLVGREQPMAAVVARAGAQGAQRPGVIILNAGLVHHVGPRRLSVEIARRLAGSGFCTARFDHRGVGDSENRRDTLPFDQASVSDLREVMDALGERYGLERFVAVGLCLGASTALRAALADSRVCGIVIMNNGAEYESPNYNLFVMNRAWARRYWSRSLFSVDCWRRALTGRIHYRRLIGVLARELRGRLVKPKDVETATDRVASEVRGLLERGVRILGLYAGGDAHALDYLHAMLGNQGKTLLASRFFETRVIDGADHMFTLHASRVALLDTLAVWALEHWPAGEAVVAQE